jgi:hypothetical protein
MSIPRVHTKLSVAVLAITIALLTVVGGAQAAVAPVKEIFSSHLGWEVNETGGNLCLASEKCRPGEFSGKPGGFEYVQDVAGAPDGNIYVVDDGNHRVQEFTAAGEFVLMFGKDVNRKGGDVCTKAEESECQAGVKSSALGQFYEPGSITVDQNGDVYVAESVRGESAGQSTFGERVQEFTASGVFVLELGKDVNETTKGNLCTEVEASEGVKCTGPALRLAGTPYEWGSEHGSFNDVDGTSILAAGGEGDLLYVGDEHRVQEFETDGQWKGEITGVGLVQAVAVDDSCASQKPALTGPACESFDPNFGDLYVLNKEGNDTIQRFSPTGQLIDEPIKVTPTHTEPEAHDVEIHIEAMAIDPGGRLALVKVERFIHKEDSFEHTSGVLYHASTGEAITEFPVPAENVSGIGFNGKDRLYVAADADEVLAYAPVSVAELVSDPQSCVAGAELGSDVTLDCALNGRVDAWGVPGTRVFFQWGSSPALGQTTSPPSAVVDTKSEGEEEPFVPASASVTGLRPNETIYYRLAGEDQNSLSPETLGAQTLSFTTPLVAPRVVGEPAASFVHYSSADLFGEVNPENASTTYEFQYAPTASCAALEGCPAASRLPATRSAAYGAIGTTTEATGLQPATSYRYRLVAENEHQGRSAGREGVFTTAPAPVPLAVTAPASGVGVTGAVASGTVDPDGQAATYTFELGVYAGAETRYGIVVSGSAGAGTIPVAEAVALSGLQPGTTYAYRVAVASGAGSDTGEAVLFTTQGLPAVLAAPAVPALLALPAIAFPTTTTSTGKPTAKKQAKKKKASRKNKRKKKAGKTSRLRGAKR